MIVGALTAAATALVNFMIRKWNARVDVQTRADTTRIDLDARKEGMELQAAAVPLQLLKDELIKREAELHDLREQDRAERTQYVETLTAMRKALEEIVTDLRSHRAEESDRSGDFHRRLDDVDDRLLVIETQLGSRKVVS